MDAATLLLAVVIAGVNFGWQPTSDGSAGYEYVVQVEPELVDVMQRGESVPIESNIPPDVTPIRKVRIVVGRGDLPRTPLRHTSLAGQAGWTPDRYPAASTNTSNYDRYPTSAGTSATGASPPPSVLDRTQTAITETGSALTDGVQAGMRSANEQLSRAGSQVMNETQNAAQQFGQQMQSAGNGLRNATEQTLDATGNQIRQAGNSLGLTGSSSSTSSAGGVSAPPWPASGAATTPLGWPADSAATRGTVIDSTASPGMAMTRTATGWTSIGMNVAAPPLLNPPIATAANSNPGLRLAEAGTGGPSFPASSTPQPRPIHSVLVDPSRQPPAPPRPRPTIGGMHGEPARRRRRPRSDERAMRRAQAVRQARQVMTLGSCRSSRASRASKTHSRRPTAGAIRGRKLIRGNSSNKPRRRKPPATRPTRAKRRQTMAGQPTRQTPRRRGQCRHRPTVIAGPATATVASGPIPNLPAEITGKPGRGPSNCLGFPVGRELVAGGLPERESLLGLELHRRTAEIPFAGPQNGRHFSSRGRGRGGMTHRLG
jgi:hypothetical protein